jgi:3-oxoacyl-[acyl-carrier protein] reductase
MSMTEARPLEGGSILVTGGGRNIGRAIAHAIALAGARVAVLERDAGGGQDTVLGISAVGGEAIEVTADLRDPASVDAAVEEAARRLGGLTGLVNNAAVYVRRPFELLTAEEWDLSLDTNLRGPFLATQAFAVPGRCRESGGSVVNLASVHGSVGDGTLVAHCAAKAGLLGFSRAAADALRPRNIRVNSVSPGAVATWKGPWDGPAPDRPLETMLVPSQVAEAVVFLLSRASAGITGSDLIIGGGTAITLRTP